MRTAYCPKSHVELASEYAGRPYGHVPGHQWHDVDVVISERDGRFRCHVVESTGSSQGRGADQEHNRTEVIGRGDSITEAADNARQMAVDADVHLAYLTSALSLAVDAAEEALADVAVGGAV